MLAKEKVQLDMNKVLSSVFSREDYGKGLDRDLVESLVTEGVAVALKMCNYHEEKLSLYGVKIYNGNCIISEKSTTIYVTNGGFWETSVGEVTIDFLTGDIFVIDESLHMERDGKYGTKVKDTVKFDHKKYGMKYDKPIDTSIVDFYMDENFEREVRIFLDNFYDKDIIRELLLNKEVVMYNKDNGHKGELTTLNKKDVDDILSDRPSVYFDEKEENVFVKYPYNFCTMVGKVK